MKPKEGLIKRRIEFLQKLKELLEEYCAVIDFDCSSKGDKCHLATDGQLEKSWKNKTILKRLDEDCIQNAINKLEKKENETN